MTTEAASLFSPLTLGCWSLISDANWGEQSEKDSLDAIEATLASGIRSFDTAPMYGNGESEKLLGKALGHRRDQVTIASKVNGHLTPETIRQSCEDSLRRLRTDYLDMLQIHWPDENHPPLGHATEELLKLKDSGKIRAIGVCNFGPRHLSEAARHIPIHTNQMPYSLLWRGLEYEVLDICRQHNIRVITYSSLMQGLLSGKFHQASDVPEGRARTKHFSSQGRPKVRHGQPGHEAATFAALDALRTTCHTLGIPMAVASLAVLLTRPEIISVIAGARNATQAQENAAILHCHLTPDQAQRLWQATDPLKQQIGPELDPWASPSRIH